MNDGTLNEREYRIVTGGEDGMICWWNLVCPNYVPESSPTEAESDTVKLAYVNANELKTIRPVHSIHLSEQAQFYGLVLGPETVMFAQNDCIITFYTVQYKTDADTAVDPLD